MKYLAFVAILSFVLGSCASGGTSKPTSSSQPEPKMPVGFAPPGLTEKELAAFADELAPHVENDTSPDETVALLTQKETETGCDLLQFSHFESPDDFEKRSVRLQAREYVEAQGDIATFFRTDRFGWLGLGADC